METFSGCTSLGLSPKNCIECIDDLIEFSNSNLNLSSFANDIDIINNQGSEMTSNPIYQINLSISKISEYINQKRQQMEQINQQTKVCQDEKNPL